MDPTSLAAGAAAGAIVGDLYENVKEAAGNHTGMATPDHGPIELHMLVDIVARIEKAILEAKEQVAPPVMSVAHLTTGNPYILKRRGYKHVSVLCTASVTVNVQTQIGMVAFALAAGWNALDLPDNVELLLPTGGPTNVIIRWGEDSLDIAGV